MTDVSDYDQFDYDYATYWNKRGYENLAEKNILNKVFSNKRGDWFLDIGGSYGRLTSCYYDQYRNPIILDYSLKTLQRNYNMLKDKYPNVKLIAANAYKMPFRDDVFDGALMVRVLHHIEEPQSYFKELRRVMMHKGTYVQEYANKVHIKAVIRGVLKRNLSIFSQNPYKHESTINSEGSTSEGGGIFYNFHPKYIKRILEKTNFKITKKYGCSYLRSPILKKIFNSEILMIFEKIMQKTLSWANISPSIILESVLEKQLNKETLSYESLTEILVCPSCKGELNIDNTTARCTKCKKSFEKLNDIWDFRVK